MQNWQSQAKVLHIEPTSKCNLACPQCQRTIGLPFFDHTKHTQDLNVEQIKSLCPEFWIKQLHKVFMCGNFGEPAASLNVLDIYKYFRSINNNITLGINTNGSLRNTNWWKKLAELFNQKLDYAVFAIDGGPDSNHIYRVNANFNKIIENATAYIDAGGSAHWDMLIFEHNEDEVEYCKKLARDIGFTWFRAKVSKRFEIAPNSVKPPKNYQVPELVDTNISCHAQQEKSVYISANGKLLPCCFFGAEVFSLDNTAINLCNNMDSIVNTWQDNPHRICSYNCGVKEEKTTFIRQWVIEEQLV